MNEKLREAIIAYKKKGEDYDVNTAMWAVSAGFLTPWGLARDPDEFAALLLHLERPDRIFDAIIKRIEETCQLTP